MRSIDQLKIDRILKAALDIVYSEGFDHISLRRIAELAKVSSGTPYVYFKDKQDLLTSLYFTCLEYAMDGLQESMNSAVLPKEKIYIWLSQMVRKYCDVPLMVKYLIGFYGRPDLFTEEVKKRYLEMYISLEPLCREAISSGQAKTSDPAVMQTMLIAPVIRLFDVYDGRENQFDPNTYEECIRLSVNSVLYE